MQVTLPVELSSLELAYLNYNGLALSWLDGSAVTDLVIEFHPIWPYGWTWAPDGDYIAYQNDETFTDFYVRAKVLNVTTRTVQGLPFEYVYQMAWDHSGQALILEARYSLNDPPDAPLFLVSPTIGKVLARLDTPNSAGFCLSPDGRFIAVHNTLDKYIANGKPYLDLIEIQRSPDGAPLGFGEVTKLYINLPDNQIDDSNCQWSPLGDQIAFVAASQISGQAGWATTVYVLGVESGSLQPLTQDATLVYEELAWSPDGRFLAFSNFGINETPTAVFIADVQDGSLIRLDPDEFSFDRNPSWTPNGEWLMFTHYLSMDLVTQVGESVLMLYNPARNELAPAGIPSPAFYGIFRP